MLRNYLLSFLSFIILLFVIINENQAQKLKKSAKLQDKYQFALSMLEGENFQAAEVMFKEIIQADPKYLDPYIALSHIYKRRKDYKKAAYYLGTVMNSDPLTCKECHYDYAEIMAGLGNFTEALKHIEAYLAIADLHPELREEAEKLRKNYDFAVQYAKKYKSSLDNYKFYPRNMGENVNSIYSEYFPTLNFDATKIYFTRRLQHRNEDFFESILDEEDSTWLKAHPLPGSVNTELNEGTQSVSLDEQWLAFTGCDFPEGLGSCDIYFSIKNRNKWGRPFNLGRKVNSEFWESQPAFSPDKRALYFAARLPDGLGGSDIYVSYLSDNGEWSYPQNLGSIINTPGDESSPFVHSDNQTLYFTSNGHQGYGGMDIFMARRNEKGKWGNVTNLGYPINTVENENCLFITSDGNTAYYASDRSDSYGGLDIYTFQLRDGIRPQETFWVHLSLHEKDKGKILPSSLSVIDMEYNAMPIKPLLNPDSTYLMSLVAGRKYFVAAQSKGYFYNYEISYRKTNDTPLVRKRKLYLEPLKINASMTMRNIFFDFDQYNLKPNSIPELNTLLEFLKLNNTISIRLEGHTDNVGDPQHNKELSEKRAGAVFEFLANRGIDIKRMQVVGFGSEKPATTNSTEQGRATNRRTEIVIIGM